MMRVLVIGDALVDRYTVCSFKKMCSDEPRMPALVKGTTEFRPGGAANVAINIAALWSSEFSGLQISLIAVVNDFLARMVKRLSRNLVDLDNVVIDDPIEKERIFNGEQPIARVDNFARFNQFIDQQIASKLRGYLAAHSPDLIVWSDYGGSTVGEETFAILRNHSEILIVDPKIKDLSMFGECDFFSKTFCGKLNRDEWAAAVEHDAYPERFFKYLIITDGGAGARIVSYRVEGRINSQPQIMTQEMTFPSFNAEVVDVCGCGDTFLAGFVVSFLRNGDPYDAVRFGNAAAATVVSQRGTAIADLDGTRRFLELQ